MAHAPDMELCSVIPSIVNTFKQYATSNDKTHGMIIVKVSLDHGIDRSGAPFSSFKARTRPVSLSVSDSRGSSYTRDTEKNQLISTRTFDLSQNQISQEYLQMILAKRQLTQNK